MLWIDADADADTDPGELISLEQAGVESLSLSYSESDLVDAEGNLHRQFGTFRTSSGQIRACDDVWFTVDPTRSRQLGTVAVSPSIAALPNIAGMGIVPSLHQAMAAEPCRRHAEECATDREDRDVHTRLNAEADPRWLPRHGGGDRVAQGDVRAGGDDSNEGDCGEGKVRGPPRPSCVSKSPCGARSGWVVPCAPAIVS